jgi:cell division protein FtsN
MAKDYAKQYTKYRYQRPKRNRHRYLWIMLGVAVGLFILGLFFLKSTNKQSTIQQTEDKLKKKILAAPVPKPPEPKFDFYNILPQDKLNLSPQAMSSVKEVLPIAKEMVASITAVPVQKPLDAMLSATPEQVAIAEVKKQLEQEMGQLANNPYFLILGSFSNATQAEQLQAQALLKGFPVRKKLGLINGKPTYQIFIGPSDLNKLVKAQKRLSAAGLDSTLTKIAP